MTNSLTTTNNNLTELWNRPGGMFAKITGVLALGGIGYALFKYVVPFLLVAATNTLLLIVELIAIVAILSMITSRTFLRAVSLTWLQVMRKIYGLVVNIDPIAILQNSINEMVKKLSIVDTNITKLESVLVDMKNKLKSYKNTFSNNIKKKEVLTKKISELGNTADALSFKADLRLVDKEITRDEMKIKAQTERISTSEKYLSIMKKLRIAANFKVNDAQNELNFRKDEYEQAKAQQKAMSSITSILKGCLTTSMEEELAMEKVSETINISIAEMNQLLDGSNDILNNFEIDSEISSAKADEIVKMFDTNGFSIFDEEPASNITFAGSKSISAGSNTKEKVILTTEDGKTTTNQRYF